MRTGREYLEGLRDGRVVYVGGERVDDVTSHPGFRAAAETTAAIFDLKFDPAYVDDLVVEDDDGSSYSTYFLAPRTPADIEKRLRCHRRITEVTHGLMGRSPDHVASLITGLAMEAQALDSRGPTQFAENLVEYHRRARQRDAFVVYAVLPHRPADESAGLEVVGEDGEGVVLRGVKSLATGAALADEIWIGNMQQIPNGEDEPITCVVPCNAPGLQLWCRRSFASIGETHGPLSSRFDEGDCVVVFDDVRVDWDHVFVHRDPTRSSEIYVRTPAHALANHQSAVRSWAKVRLMVGLARRIAHATGAFEVAAVSDALGRLAAYEATIAGLVDAQVHAFEHWPSGGVAPNRRYVYASLAWGQQAFPAITEVLRELVGSGMFRYPLGPEAVDDPDVGPLVKEFGLNDDGSNERISLFRLAWDLVGSEFAGRQNQYEQLYAGPPFVVRAHCRREAPWAELDESLATLADGGGAQTGER